MKRMAFFVAIMLATVFAVWAGGVYLMVADLLGWPELPTEAGRWLMLWVMAVVLPAFLLGMSGINSD